MLDTTTALEMLAPNGALILGTVETIPGDCRVNWSRSPGTLTFEHAGETALAWDQQETLHLDGEPVFIDEDGDLWKRSSLIEDEGSMDPHATPDLHHVPTASAAVALERLVRAVAALCGITIPENEITAEDLADVEAKVATLVRRVALIRLRLDGVFDHPLLEAFGPLMTDETADIRRILDLIEVPNPPKPG